MFTEIKLFKAIAKCHLRLSRSLQQGGQSYLRHPGEEPLSHRTLGQVIEDTVHKYPGRLAVRSLHEERDITYEELLNRADSLGCALRQNGFSKGDRLGIWSHNNMDWIIALVAAARVGLISVLINPLYEASELSYCIKKAELRGLVIGENINTKRYYDMIKQMIPDISKAKEGELKSAEYPSLTTVLACGKEKFDGVNTVSTLARGSSHNASQYGKEVKADDGTIIHFTSGTTGNPKAALDSHLGVVNNCYYVGQRNSLNEGHPIVCMQAPMFHALGSIITLLSPIQFGATIVLASPTYNVPNNLNALLSQKCTYVSGTPTMYVDLLSHINGADLPLKLNTALSGGAPCSPQLIQRMKNTLKTKEVKALYGLTETTASVFQSVPGDSVDVVAETVGYIQDHVEVKVVDDKKNMVPWGSPGELLVRGYLNMIGYWGEPEKTRQTIDEDGWVATGDTFTISQDGYGRIVGRIKDIIVRGGENIAPKEIEDLLNTHPDVLETQVVGVADERLGEELCAVLKLREGATLAAVDVRKFCEGRLAKFKIPRIVKSTVDFPKTASGKIQKYRIKELIEAGKL
ncbi:medium-chain acyl-CoA ligase ACSF2, mitochondrial [Aricia agestis]|uniref:medium-chain acyl-CoA ligase ACSF2, mitochondrial n=1 Tax=Aricia agestis TaxID=91739 RepID=UPI001C204AB1|nr:medium-chain acyl-CoA ligase ACSF2, mitochondrial [Aricia agestis]